MTRTLGLSLLCWIGCRSPHGLPLAIGQCAPEPLHRPKAEAGEAPSTEHYLYRVDDNRENDSGGNPYLTIQPETIAEEEDRADGALQQVIG